MTASSGGDGAATPRSDERVLALFDFDGTITRGDSYVGFARFAVGRRRLVTALLAAVPSLAVGRRGGRRLTRAKELVLMRLFRGWERTRFDEVGRRYARLQLPSIVRPAALACIHGHLGRGHRVVVVSGSLRAWLEPWCADAGLELLVTEVEVRNGRLTGRFAGRNCWGPEKARRVRAAYSLEAFHGIVAYGDSRGDREMLELAGERHLRPFRGC